MPWRQWSRVLPQLAWNPTPTQYWLPSKELPVISPPIRRRFSQLMTMWESPSLVSLLMLDPSLVGCVQNVWTADMLMTHPYPSQGETFLFVYLFAFSSCSSFYYRWNSIFVFKYVMCNIWYVKFFHLLYFADFLVILATRCRFALRDMERDLMVLDC